MVSGVKTDSAADLAGLRAGDLIVDINGREVVNAIDLKTQLALLRVGDRVALRFVRDGETRRISALMGDPYKDFVTGRSISRKFRGALLGEVIDRSTLGNNPGIAVGPVDEDSNAWLTGLREGDVVFRINRTRVKNLEELREAAEEKLYRIELRRGKRLISLVSR